VAKVAKMAKDFECEILADSLVEMLELLDLFRNYVIFHELGAI